ncbi:hypothetical protein QFC19_001444 [Naganishia cerealis]|uniref:Uncharacterized protein n=1 Tax=Naganishia cerealis TaxID=610337 RepID=A0ACC2WH07_9TREE|nr:hypothetical protein QFC19_001444 [Naganishia cerealis]
MDRIVLAFRKAFGDDGPCGDFVLVKQIPGGRGLNNYDVVSIREIRTLHQLRSFFVNSSYCYIFRAGWEDSALHPPSRKIREEQWWDDFVKERDIYRTEKQDSVAAQDEAKRQEKGKGKGKGKAHRQHSDSAECGSDDARRIASECPDCLGVFAYNELERHRLQCERNLTLPERRREQHNAGYATISSDSDTTVNTYDEIKEKVQRMFGVADAAQAGNKKRKEGVSSSSVLKRMKIQQPASDPQEGNDSSQEDDSARLLERAFAKARRGGHRGGLQRAHRPRTSIRMAPVSVDQASLASKKASAISAIAEGHSSDRTKEGSIPSPITAHEPESPPVASTSRTKGNNLIWDVDQDKATVLQVPDDAPLRPPPRVTRPAPRRRTKGCAESNAPNPKEKADIALMIRCLVETMPTAANHFQEAISRFLKNLGPEDLDKLDLYHHNLHLVRDLQHPVVAQGNSGVTGGPNQIPSPELDDTLSDQAVVDTAVQDTSINGLQGVEAIPEANPIDWDYLSENLPHLLAEMSRVPVPPEVEGDGFLEHSRTLPASHAHHQGSGVPNSRDASGASGSLSRPVVHAAAVAANHPDVTPNNGRSSPLTDDDASHSGDPVAAHVARPLTRAAARILCHRAARPLEPHKGTRLSRTSLLTSCDSKLIGSP